MRIGITAIFSYLFKKSVTGRFLSFGSVLFFGNYISFWVLFLLFENLIQLWFIAVIHYILSVLISHHVYRTQVFEVSSANYGLTLLKYFASTSTLGAASVGGLLVLVDFVGIPVFVSHLTVTAVMLGVGFFIGRHFTFS